MSRMRTTGQRFLDFFFAPSDPTTMAFIRIVTGSLIVYTHLAYSYDLQNFFGEHAYYGLKYIDRERKEVPNFVPPMDWEDPYFPLRQAQIPEQPHRRKPMMQYLTKLVDVSNPADFDRKIAYLTRLQKIDQDLITRRLGDGKLAADGLRYLSELATDPKDRASQLAVLAEESLREAMRQTREPPLPIPTSPRAINTIPNEARMAFSSEADEFFRTLPADFDHRAIVLMTWNEMDYGQREALLNMLRRIAKLNPEERAVELDYFNYWNVDRGLATRLGAPVFSLWFHVTDPTEMRIAHTCILIVFVMFTIGLYTRITSVLTWLGILTYIHRSQQIVFGMDTMMNILMIYLMISHCGGALSVDRLWNRYRAVRASLDRSGKLDAITLEYLQTPTPTVATGFAQRLLQMHFCFIYMAAGMSKLKGSSWWSTNAYWDTLANPEFTLVYYEWYENLLREIVAVRPLYAALAAGGVLFTFVAELGLPFLVWTRLRPWAVMMGVMLHFGIGFFMGLIVFSLFMMTMLLSYLPGQMISKVLFTTVPGVARRKLIYNPNDPAQVHEVAVRIAGDFCNETAAEPQPGAALQEIVLQPSESKSGPWQAILRLLTFPARKLGV
ncbi:MAG: hypothetical protein ACRC8S_18410 [Fimbriiglobus sp.]